MQSKELTVVSIAHAKVEKFVRPVPSGGELKPRVKLMMTVQVVKRNWLFVDIDPVREAEILSTDAEVKDATDFALHSPGSGLLSTTPPEWGMLIVAG